MNLEKMLELSISARHNEKDLILLTEMIRNELESSIAKQSGKKDTYNAIKNYIKH